MGRPGITTEQPTALPERELLSRVFRTLGEPSRVRIIDALHQRGAATQGELVDACNLSQSRASEHLATLAWAGLIRAQREGRTVRYELAGHWAIELLRLARVFLYDYDKAVGGCTVLMNLSESEFEALLGQTDKPEPDEKPPTIASQ